jgi:hypothetical protein
MADVVNNTAAILSVCATTSDKIKDLVIKNGQLVFVQDTCRIAFDFNGKRKFYNQIVELDSEQERLDLLEPVNGKYYFVIETAILWRYFNGWNQLTSSPSEIIFFGTEMPELGKPKTLYVNTKDGNENISVWNKETSTYQVVADKTQSISNEEIITLFN